jgi:hypothetical protein
MTDDRVARLTPWARDLISEQERTIGRLTADVAALQDRVAGVIRAGSGADTVLVSEATTMTDGSDHPDTPLGDGVLVRFGDFYEVRYDQAAGALVIEGDDGLAVTAGHWSKFIVRRA